MDIYSGYTYIRGACTSYYRYNPVSLPNSTEIPWGVRSVVPMVIYFNLILLMCKKCDIFNEVTLGLPLNF